MARSFTAFMLLLVSSLIFSGCSLKAGPAAAKAPTGLIVEKVTAGPSRWTAVGGAVAKVAGDSAVYLTISNGVTADRLVSAKVPLAKTVEMVRTVTDQGTSNTSPVTAIDIPAHSRVELKPGGYHLMMVNPIHGLSPGDSFSLVLVFEKAGQIIVPVTVQQTARS